jgi:hypothetical protein
LFYLYILSVCFIEKYVFLFFISKDLVGV